MKEFLMTQNHWLIMTLWVIIGLVIESAIAEKYTNEILIWTPKIFYEDMKMNWFGSWFCFILSIIINPCGTFVKLLLCIIVCLCYVIEFIKWLFTVGRKDEE